MADYLAENQCPKCGKKLNTGFKCEVCDTMADKEERIEISTYDLNNKEWNGDIPIDIHKVYTRQEAIHKIGVALCVADGNIDCKECIYRGTDNCKTQLKNWYLKDAEVAFNALLER